MHRGGWLSKNDWGRAEHRLFRGHYSGGQGTYWRARYGALIDIYQVSLDRLRGRKCLRARRRYRTGNGAIDIRDIDGLLVDDDRVVNVIDHGRVHRGVRDIDVAHVTETGGVGRYVHFTRGQCKPGDACPCSDPRNKGGRIHRPNIDSDFKSQ